MEETEARINELLLKYQEGKCTAEEKAQIETIYLYHDQRQMEELSPEAYDSVKQEIWNNLPGSSNSKPKFRFTHYKKIATAAAVVAILGAGVFYFYGGQLHLQKENHTVTADVKPGTNTAILTLANGKKIRLDEAGTGTLASESGVSIIKTADGQLIYEIANQKGNTSNEYNTLSTANAETYRVKLPDGTMVWLNAASSLVYPSSFAKAPFREVSLSGEAYFEVTRNAKQPFVVKSGKQKIEVIGTHFNINSYPDESAIKTTLVEGSIKVSLPGTSQLSKSLHGSRTEILKPGQQAVVSDDLLKVNYTDLERATDWKNGDFIFESEPLDMLMRRVSKWYNVKISYAKNVDQREEFTGKVSRKKNISELLKALQSAGQIKFTIDNQHVLIENQ